MWVQINKNGMMLWQVAAWQKYDWLVHGFTTNEWGNLALHVNDDANQVIKRRERFSEALGVCLDQWIVGNQVHQTKIATIDKSHQGAGARSTSTALSDTDALVTDEQELLLVSFYADCVPLLFVEPDQRIIGLAHAGWRGTASEISVLMAEKFETFYQVDPKDLQVAIGPSIGCCCYQVGSEVADQFESDVITKFANKLYLDLKLANRLQLIRYGIAPENIFNSEVCTSCNSCFYSYRREGERSGRMGSFLGKGFQ